MSSQPLMFFVAFLAVLALIGVAAWLVRHFAGNRLGSNANRGRMPRLAVIDAAAVDGRRRLVLVRRDNVEHLLMIGGPSDIVIEPNIVRASASRDQLPTRGSLEPRLTAPEPAPWDEPAAEPQEPELPPIPTRPSRPAFAEEPRRAPMPERMPERRPADPFAGLVPEPIARPEPPMPPMPRAEPPLPPMPRAEPPMPPMQRAEPPMPPMQRAEPPIMRADPPIMRPEPPRPEPRPEPRMDPAPRPRAEPAMPRPPRPEPKPAAPAPRAERPAPPAPPMPPAPPPAPASSADQNLAEMATRLEAALRRPPNAPTEPAPPVAPEPPARPTPPPSRGAQPTEAEPAAATSAPAAGKTGFESLEDEMAALLGRPKSPT
ncbi:hypothetical protein DNX69_24450 [Rhodopseudomonas palustris]|uniref:Flagellar biosynthesis protein FliO n=1 Tax=Rhodopseudomonas palustris TaxID=1076 RepID=A0A323UE92_RHOPL|nr:flagellar biosynthetic protein FliO [Rhodopseudomonas palustris]PZA09256.1 hypothetical protein DNX69_24450 [Rhodopseudomonas palustris]